MDKDEVLKLAKLARIGVTDTEAENLASEFEGILNYVAEVKTATAGNTAHTTPAFVQTNIMREDNNHHTSGEYTESILKAAPQSEGQYIKVKKIL